MANSDTNPDDDLPLELCPIYVNNFIDIFVLKCPNERGMYDF